MSTISIDREALVGLFRTFESHHDDLRAELNAVPGAADAGPASMIVGAIVVAVSELSEKAIVVGAGLTALSLEVADDLLAGDQQAADELEQFEKLNLT